MCIRDRYEWSQHQFGKARTVSGSLTDFIDVSAEIYYGSLPVPGPITDTGSFNGYEVEVLLSVDSKPLVYSLTHEDFTGSRIIIVGNGSLLLNLPLVNSSNRQIAEQLLESIDEFDDRWNDVLFVENDDEIAISDVDVPDDASKWSWITKPPLRYMVPNLVFWCMLFCFVYFPIFGRPQQIEKKSTADFRDHIFALARLVAGTHNRKHPSAWLEKYTKNSNRNQKLK